MVRTLALMAAMLVGLPIVGVLLDRRPVRPYLEFPPLTRYVEHARFSWGVFILLSLLIPACLWLTRPQRARLPPDRLPTAGGAAGVFPVWGWLGLGLLGIAWAIAWTRLQALAEVQRFTLAPLCIGYILFVNALSYGRTGRCLLSHHRGFLLALFPLSAAFWWFFEYLNRFVQNWYYVGIDDFGRWQYFWYATLPFATVLPAVMSTSELLASLPRLAGGVAAGRPRRMRRPRTVALLTLCVAGGGLAGIGVWPDFLFPLLWVAPLLIVLALQSLTGAPTILDPLRQGDWRALWLPALAGLICGFFWELWNFGSLAKWRYTIPHVDRFHVFEMPLLGYAGYLPFGLECAAISQLCTRGPGWRGSWDTHS